MSDDLFDNGDGENVDDAINTPADGSKGKKDDLGFSGGDSGLGNLPPLSDFESSEGTLESDMGSDLPPLGGDMADDDMGMDDSDSLGGLPPISQINVDTPVPTGGGGEQTSSDTPGFDDSDAFDTPTSSGNLDTPEPLGGTGFQDLAADSDFSPETPDIGPGPDSDLDTPMFDSAFGGDTDSNLGIGGTPAPTQAMETPMFGETPTDSGERPQGQGAAPPDMMGFDEGAFGATPAGGFDAGTPIPDFSPDTGVPGQGPLPITATGIPEGEPPKKKKKKSSGAVGVLVQVLVILIVLVVGVVAGPFLSSKVSFLPNPLAADVEQKDADIRRLSGRVKQLEEQITPDGPGPVSQEEIDNLLAQRTELNKAIEDLAARQQDLKSKISDAENELRLVEEDIQLKNEEFVSVQEMVDDKKNETAIVEARHAGLVAEVNRLTNLVGELEDANARRMATKSALAYSVERLAVSIREGIPLTPQKYSRDERIARVDKLKQEIDQAKWVAPDLLQQYSALYLDELDIAGSSEYFFARIPVKDRYGNTEMKWSECLMQGNWAVYFRSLDGQNIGSYENVAEEGVTPQYEFRELLPAEVKTGIEQEIIASRIPDWEAKVRVMAEKQLLAEPASALQQAFDGL